MQVNPADQFAWLQRILARLDAQETRIRDLEQARQTYAQTATVSAYVGGNTCDVTFDSGDTMTIGLLAGYTPSVGHVVDVIISPFRSVVIGREA